ncbi:DUF6933 domain-containing protein [Frigoriglobus tundricola]|uniref:DUF6933 domain-containing protein n=1 Tax=Frigoriglobus tundricola TaxID=2774151 RepID=A0A6M5YZ82_9BACT|nr:hypothetical protein [Frigoriglobus tundricola]QJW98533.1 hypothetical protein FTUN_6125 [Frigoriglobus tundricola]
MVLRLSQKLNARIKGGTLSAAPPHENSLLDWSAQAFAVGRAEYVLLSNTRTLYSVVLAGMGLRDTARLPERALGVIRATLEGTGHGANDRHHPTPAVESVRLAKALDRSVTGSMNELIVHATALLVDGGVSLAEVGVRLNDVLLSALAVGSNKYGRPRDAFAERVAAAGSDEQTGTP